MTFRLAASVGAAACAVALSGCGRGPGASNVSLTVTSDFGSRTIGAVTERRVPGSETVMRMLERSFRIGTRYGAGFVESIDDHSGGKDRLDWFYYVNGIMAPVGAAGTVVHRGDRIWWDLHHWLAPGQPEAVVGSFPEPFVHGSGGRRLPTVLECFADAGAACAKVAAELHAVGVPVASQAPGTGSGTDSLAVLVGPWADLRASVAADLIERGPSASGVYAKFAADGGTLELLDPHGRPAGELGAGAGLIAAVSEGSEPPTWIVTGTDQAGVRAAAAHMTPAGLDGHFAIAAHGGRELALPLRPAS